MDDAFAGAEPVSPQAPGDASTPAPVGATPSGVGCPSRRPHGESRATSEEYTSNGSTRSNAGVAEHRGCGKHDDQDAWAWRRSWARTLKSTPEALTAGRQMRVRKVLREMGV